MEKKNVLLVKTKGRLLFLEWGKIFLVAAQGNYVNVHYGSKVYHIRETLLEISRRLGSPPFIRISRSTIINVHYIREMRNRHSLSAEVILTNNTKCTWSRSYKPQLNTLMEFMSAV